MSRCLHCQQVRGGRGQKKARGEGATRGEETEGGDDRERLPQSKQEGQQKGRNVKKEVLLITL